MLSVCSTHPNLQFFLICMGIQHFKSGGPFPLYFVLRIDCPFCENVVEGLHHSCSYDLKILLSDLFLSSKLAIIYNLNISKIAFTTNYFSSHFQIVVVVLISLSYVFQIHSDVVFLKLRIHHLNLLHRLK